MVHRCNPHNQCHLDLPFIAAEVLLYRNLRSPQSIYPQTDHLSFAAMACADDTLL